MTSSHAGDGRDQRTRPGPPRPGSSTRPGPRAAPITRSSASCRAGVALPVHGSPTSRSAARGARSRLRLRRPAAAVTARRRVVGPASRHATKPDHGDLPADLRLVAVEPVAAEGRGEPGPHGGPCVVVHLLRDDREPFATELDLGAGIGGQVQPPVRLAVDATLGRHAARASPTRPPRAAPAAPPGSRAGPPRARGTAAATGAGCPGSAPAAGGSRRRAPGPR